MTKATANVLIEHHPTIGDISSPTNPAEGDVKQITTKATKGHLPPHLYYRFNPIRDGCGS